LISIIIKIFKILQLFARVIEESPECRDKVVPVDGDLTLPSLGLSAADQALLQEHVSVVFHSGATVRFTDTLRNTTNINVAGTKRVLDFSTLLPKLQVSINN
jgi:fatty acyl-CoA reductase